MTTVIQKNLPKQKEYLVCVLLFVAALLVRLIYVYVLKNTPFFEPLAPKLDDGVYDLMGQAISGGNWMADVPFGAYRIPLYPYFLGVIYHFFGRNILLVHLIQSAVGAMTPILVYLISKRVFKDQQSALLAGIIASFYLPFIFFENLLLGESFSIFLSLLSLFLLILAFEKKERQALLFFFSGIFFGLSILFRPNMLIPIFFVSAYIFWKKGFKTFLIISTAVLLTLLPITVRNYRLYKDFLPISAVGGVNLYVGNNPEADGKFHLVKGIGTGLDEMVKNSHEIAEQDAGTTLKPSQASSYWVHKTVGFVLGSPAQFLNLLVRKAFLFFNHYEFPDILDMYFVAQFVPILKFNFAGYGVIALFGVLGFFISMRMKNPQIQLLGIFSLGYFLSVILFFITARYRLPIVPFFILFGSFAFQELWKEFHSKEKRNFFQYTTVLVLASVLVFWPVESTNFATNYNSLAICLKNKGDFEAAEKYYRKSIEIAPPYPSPYYNLGLLFQKLGREEEAQELFRKYEELKQISG